MRASMTRLSLGSLVAMAWVASAGGCGKTASCRPSTLFLNVDLGPYATATRLDVDVMVATATAPEHTQLALKGAGAGGLEVDFPHGYPAGENASVVLTLYAQTTELAARTTMVHLAAECSVVSVDFGGDAGQDAAGRAGAGGGGGGRGGGSAGTTGLAGAPAGTAGAGVGGASGTGGSNAGNGGQAGRAAGTAGSSGGTAGAGTAGAGTGGAGTAGAGTAGAGAGGHAGSGGAPGGAGGGCVRTGPENCFNSLDDDCDGQVDCADSDCAPAVAQCVALDPSAGKIGLGEGAGTVCPSGYANLGNILSGLTPGTCSGCSCAPGAVSCQTTLYGYKDAASCSAAVQGIAVGAWKTGSEGAQCVNTPSWSGVNPLDTIYGVGVDPFVAVSSACLPSGRPTVSAPTWTATLEFCGTGTIGGGCGAGKVCVPAAPKASVCQLLDGAAACPAGTKGSDWYSGYSGSQTCGACTCGKPTTGSCASVRMTVGSDYTCSGAATLTSGGQACFATGIYHPGVAFAGSGTSGTCPADSAVSGTLTPTGRKTLCCF